MITFFDTKEKSKEPEKCLDSQLWHACAGSMVQMSPVGSIVFYFPQGHSEHSREFVDFRKIPQLRSYIACRVSDIRFMADPETDEVFAKIKLNPVRGNETELDDIVIENEKPPSFAKTLTQSDANNGGGFSVPRYCAETIFPKLDYSADPPVQTILARDVHGETWKFRHIYRGTPRRHLLTTGWSAFVNHKKLVAGDSIVFLRTRSGELCVGIRRAKRGIGGGGLDSPSGWNSSLPYGGSDPPPGWNISNPYRGSDPPPGWNSSLPYGGISVFLREGENQLMRNGSCNGGERLSMEKMSTNSVIDAMNLAATEREFEVVYYPRASTPEFCIKASLVKTALQIRWCSGMRFKMPFETEDSSRISWFMGTISSVQVADPIRWPDSPWRLLQVTWDEPDLLQNVKHVSPWLVELVSTMPPLHLSPFSPPWKKPKHQHPEFPLQIPSFAGAHLLGSSNTQIPSFAGLNHMITPTNALISSFAGAHPVAPANGQTPSFAGAPLRAPVDAPAGMQGARHTQFNTPLPDFHFEKLHSALFATSFPHFDTQKPQKNAERENISCLLTIGRSKSTQDVNKTENSKTTATQFVLFGQPILTEQQILLSSSGNSSSESNPQKKMTCEELDTDLENGHCKVFMDSDDVGRTLDLSRLGSYEELYQKLANMFGTENSEITNHVLWRDVTGSVKQIGNEPFGDFMKTAKRLTILTDSGSDNVGV